MTSKKRLNIIGILLLLGGFFLFIDHPYLTGFAIIEQVPSTTLQLIGLAFMLGGIVLFVLRHIQDKYFIHLLINSYETGKLSPVETAFRINELEDVEITGVDYRGENKEIIKTNTQYFSVRLQDKNKARDLALALYEIALINDRRNARNCELHVGKGTSSKHHRTGLDRLVKDFESRYKKDLVTARK